MTMRRIFPRKAGCAISVEAHIKALAHRVLDKAKTGDAEAAKHIDWALMATGDLVGGGGAPVRPPAPRKNWVTGFRP